MGEQTWEITLQRNEAKQIDAKWLFTFSYEREYDEKNYKEIRKGTENFQKKKAFRFREKSERMLANGAQSFSFYNKIVVCRERRKYLRLHSDFNIEEGQGLSVIGLQKHQVGQMSRLDEPYIDTRIHQIDF